MSDVPSRVSNGLEVALFGHVRLAFDGKPLEFGAPRKTLPILAYLLVHRDAAISREFLAFLMWPDDEEDVARNNLRRNLTLFKTILPPRAPAENWILATNEFVRWNPDAPYSLDIAEFDRLLPRCVSNAEFGPALAEAGPGINIRLHRRPSEELPRAFPEVDIEHMFAQPCCRVVAAK